MVRAVLLLVGLFSPLLSVAGDSLVSGKIIRLAATTSIENSGLLEHLMHEFLGQHAYQIRLTVVGSGKALRLGRTGHADVVWVNSPAAETTFVEQGYGINRQTVMRNDFVLAGPENDPAGAGSAASIVEALRMLAGQGAVFVSRGDDSGTNKKELSLWKQAGIDPYGTDWYMETGVDMAESLVMAEEEKAYIMIDRATFEVRHGHGIRVLLEDPANLSTPYSVIAVNPVRNKSVNLEGANTLINWLVSEHGQALISAYAPMGRQLYYPVAIPADN